MSTEKPWAPDLFHKQLDIYNTRKRIVLADGSRLSGKTVAVCHKIMRHLTETPGARVGCFAASIKAAKDAGSWQLLIETIIPEWQEANLVDQNGKSINYLTRNSEKELGPKVDANTRTAYFKWRNCYGGSSECQLFSIDNMSEIAAKVKNKCFSMIWLMELSNWEDRRVLSMLMPCLRMKHLMPHDGTPQNYHQWIADTNPHEDLGVESWVYKLFYQERNNPPQGDSEDDKQRRAWLADMEVINFNWKDNPYATKQQVADLRYSCGLDQAVLDSHYHGIYGEGGVKKEKHFANFFIKSRHVIGGGDDEGDQIEVSKNTVRLYTGWDLGIAVNHASVILEKRLPATPNGEQVQWNVLDEQVVIGEDCDLIDYTHQFMNKIEAIEASTGRKFDWVHWSDDTAVNVFRAAAGTYDCIQVITASSARLRKRFESGEIAREDIERLEIKLQGVVKPAHSRRNRVRIVRQLLHENRLFISSRCVAVIAMLEHLRKTEKEYIFRDEHVHIFDALTYPMYAESSSELLEEAFRPHATAKEDADESRLVSV